MDGSDLASEGMLSNTYPNNILQLKHGPVFGDPSDLADENSGLEKEEVALFGGVADADREPIVGQQATELVDAATVAFDAVGELVVVCPVGDTQHQLQRFLEIGVVFTKTSAVPYQFLKRQILFSVLKI